MKKNNCNITKYIGDFPRQAMISDSLHSTSD